MNLEDVYSFDLPNVKIDPYKSNSASKPTSPRRRRSSISQARKPDAVDDTGSGGKQSKQNHGVSSS